jgi:hypothetical protein
MIFSLRALFLIPILHENTKNEVTFPIHWTILVPSCYGLYIHTHLIMKHNIPPPKPLSLPVCISVFISVVLVEFMMPFLLILPFISDPLRNSHIIFGMVAGLIMFLTTIMFSCIYFKRD